MDYLEIRDRSKVIAIRGLAFRRVLELNLALLPELDYLFRLMSLVDFGHSCLYFILDLMLSDRCYGPSFINYSTLRLNLFD